MQPSIPNGTVLQNRYRLLGILGQGGFGRTYLAEDLGRFNERCALKEFSPLSGSDYALNKSKELFQREAAILYQIQHPQIPQFRATFEEDQRLYLVQDYVEGKTYRALLSDRKAQQTTFTEAEVLRLMQQLLPVLAHIHGKGIIHRDIAPDNIMLRQDNLPVLIDFGVVKEIATRISTETVTQATTVGKMGYAPSEQMQTGRAYPSSDLYALAVSTIVLLTGKEPQELYDDQNLTWHWQRWAPTHAGFAEILDRMLSYRPSDRYQSAAEVMQALQTWLSPPQPQPQPAPAPKPPAFSPIPSRATSSGSGAAPPGRTPSRMQTVAVGRRAEPAAPPITKASGNTPRSTSTLPSIQEAERPFWENPWALVITTIGLATLSGIAAWAIVSAILNSSQPPELVTESTPAAIDSPTAPAADPVPTEVPSEVNSRLDIQPTGTSIPVEGVIKVDQTYNYSFSAGEGDTLSIAVDQGEVILGVLDADGNPVSNQAAQFRRNWQGQLPAGDYTVRVRPKRNVEEETYYRFNVSLQPIAAPTLSPTPEASPSPETSPSPEASPSPETSPSSELTEPSPEPETSPSPEQSPETSPSPEASPEPAVDTQVLNLPVGSPIDFPDQASDAIVRRYLVSVATGQELYVQVLQGEVTLDIRYPDGRFIEGGEGVRNWQQQIGQAGEYQIDVVASQSTEFFLRVGVNGQGSEG